MAILDYAGFNFREFGQFAKTSSTRKLIPAKINSNKVNAKFQNIMTRFRDISVRTSAKFEVPLLIRAFFPLYVSGPGSKIWKKYICFILVIFDRLGRFSSKKNQKKQAVSRGLSTANGFLAKKFSK